MYRRNGALPGSVDGRRSAAGIAGIHPRRGPGQAEARALTAAGVRPKVDEVVIRKLTAADASGALRRDVLRALDRYGPLTAAEIPRSWPITRPHVRDLLRDMVTDGLLEVTAESYGCRSFRLSDLGRVCLEELDWSAAIEADLRDAGGGE
jgi:DNA-binding HxlR family transcriptional regulator